jgi:hypothetical protein
MSRELMQQALDALEYHTMQTKPINHTDKAIEALKQELAKPEPQVCCGDYEKCWKACTPRGRWLAEQEIVKSESHIVKWSIPVDPNNFGEPLVQVKQSNYSDIVSDGGLDPRNKFDAPPRKPWVGLTGTEINHIFAANVGYPERMCLAIEAKLKELNT